jgi:hypothetical protein
LGFAWRAARGASHRIVALNTTERIRGPGHVPTPPRPQTGFAAASLPQGWPHFFTARLIGRKPNSLIDTNCQFGRLRSFAPACDIRGMAEENTDSFRDVFVRVLLDKLPSWREFVAERAQNGRVIEITPRNWKGPPFTIDVRGDTVTVCPLCNFGLDYISTATAVDLQQEPHRVFAKPISEIADFVTGRSVVAIKRNRFLFVNAGWNVRFVPVANAHDARDKGFSIAAWPEYAKQ